MVAAGDSYNDAAMLDAADAGVWFRAPAGIREQFPSFPACEGYDQLLDAIDAALVG